MDDGMKYIFVMTPLMAEIAATADFDITYDHMQGYKYIFYSVAFNHVTMEWMIIQCTYMYVGINKLCAWLYNYMRNSNFENDTARNCY